MCNPCALSCFACIISIFPLTPDASAFVRCSQSLLRLNDFQQFVFGPDVTASYDIPPGTLITDLRACINDEEISDVTFIVEDKPVHAHKLLCTRCEYFKAMLSGQMRESRATEIVLPHLRHQIFLAVLEYLYTDEVEVPLDETMELFQAADKFGISRLKLICECRMLNSITVDNAAGILLAADAHHASGLRQV